MRRLLGIVLLAAGLAALVYGGFSYTRKSHELDVGALKFGVAKRERIAVPVWAGVVAVVAGAALLATGKR